MKIVFAVTGIGQPYYEHKLEILKSNLEKLNELDEHKIQLIISFYDDSAVPEWLNFMISELNIELVIVRESNHIGSFIHKYLVPHKLDFDYLFLILDDVLLPDDFSFNKMIKTYEYVYNCNNKKTILSCSLSNDSKIGHKYMVTEPLKLQKTALYLLRKVKKCEYFFYIMNKRSYNRYYDIINSYPEYTERMWGVDLLLKKYHLNAYICDEIICKHFYSHGAGQFASICKEKMKILLKKPHPPDKCDVTQGINNNFTTFR